MLNMGGVSDGAPPRLYFPPHGPPPPPPRFIRDRLQQCEDAEARELGRAALGGPQEWSPQTQKLGELLRRVGDELDGNVELQRCSFFWGGGREIIGGGSPKMGGGLGCVRRVAAWSCRATSADHVTFLFFPRWFLLAA